MSVDERARPRHAEIASDWPLFRLRLATDRLELRPPTDDEVAELARVARRGIHGDDVMPFANGWTDYPAREFGRRFAQYFWSQRAAWRVDDWALPFAVFLDGEPVGVQQMKGVAFPQLPHDRDRLLARPSASAPRHRQRDEGRSARLRIHGARRGCRRHRRLQLQPGLDRRLPEARIRAERHAARRRPRRPGRRVALPTLARAVARNRAPRRRDRRLRGCVPSSSVVDEPK